MIEVERVLDAVIAALKTDAVITSLALGGVWRAGFAPQGTTAAFPFLDVSDSSSVSVGTISGRRVMDNVLILVRAFDKGPTMARLRALMDRADVILDGLRTVRDGVMVVMLRRESVPPIAPEIEGGVVYPRRQLLFRTEAYALP